MGPSLSSQFREMALVSRRAGAGWEGQAALFVKQSFERHRLQVCVRRPGLSYHFLSVKGSHYITFFFFLLKTC